MDKSPPTGRVDELFSSKKGLRRSRNPLSLLWRRWMGIEPT
jgi:hypothetical protein